MASWDEKYAGWKPIFECCGITVDENLWFTPDGSKRILTICQGGNSRSVAAGFLLKYKYKLDAIACSWERNAPSTLKMLMAWADTIILMKEDMLQYIPERYHGKVKIADVGDDKWQNGLHPELLVRTDAYLSKWFFVPNANAK